MTDINLILDKIIKKTEYMHKQIGVAMPYSVGKDGKYEDRSDTLPEQWTNGFYPGMLWLLYEETGNESYKDYAHKIDEKLANAFKKPSLLHHDMGFMFMLSSAKNYELTGCEEAKERALLAAYVLASRYNIKSEYIRAWPGKEKKALGIIDCMMNIPLLYWASKEEEDERFSYIADSFAHTIMRSHIRPDGSVNHIVEFDVETGDIVKNYGGQGYAEGSSWSRGQAWAISGFAQAYKWTKNPEYLAVAKRVANYFIASLEGDYVPRCDFRQPKEPHIVDTTAGVIAATGFVDIAESLPELERDLYLDAAMKIIKTYDEKVCDWSLDNEAIVTMGTVEYHKPSEIHIPLIYGDYYFVETVLKLKKYLERQ